MNRPDRIKIGTVGLPLPGVAIKIAEDGEILIKGVNVFPGYWRNEAATNEVFTEDGWFPTGDIGELDEEGFLKITGRKKEMIVTAGGKNVAPAVLEDRLRSHALISQCMVVGDGKPFIAALITLDVEALGPWKERNGKPADATVASLRDDPELSRTCRSPSTTPTRRSPGRSPSGSSGFSMSTSPRRPASSASSSGSAGACCSRTSRRDIDALYS